MTGFFILRVVWSPCAILSVLLWLAGCTAPRPNVNHSIPTIEFTSVPPIGKGNPAKVSTFKGRVFGAKPGQQIVLYARAEYAWWVQPFVDQPFTTIRPDSKWQNVTHPGTEYAALLVEPGFQPLATTDSLPKLGVVTTTVVHGEPALWQRWWFPFPCVLAGVLVALGLYRWRLHQLTKRLNVRFEERLVERTRVAQDLHDTLLQGVVSASMQLHVAVDQLPDDSPAQPALNRVLNLMNQVVQQGHNVVRGLRFSSDDHHDLERAFSHIRREFDVEGRVNFRVTVEGTPQPVRAAVRDDLYSIGREALVNAFRHSSASNIAVELEYTARQMRISVRDNGCGIDPQVLRMGRKGHGGLHRGLSGMRERAERIGARLRVFSRPSGGTEIELFVPSHAAFQLQSPNGRLRWLSRWYHSKTNKKHTAVKKGSEINE